MESTPTITHLQELLAVKTRILNMVMAIDAIRDNHPNPAEMVEKIVDYVAQSYETDVCLMALLNHETEQIEVQAIQERPGAAAEMTSLLTAPEILYSAMGLNGITIWRKDSQPADIPLPQHVEVAVMPIILKKNEPLGVMILACRERSFSDTDVECLEYIEDHIDSAVIQGHNYYELEHRNKQLELINKIDQIRDQHLPVDQMLSTVLKILIQEIPSEQGYAMLYDQSDESLVLRASTSESLFSALEFVGQLTSMAKQTLKDGTLFLRNHLNHDKLDSIMCLPLILRNKIIGVLGLINRQSDDGFLMRDAQLFTAAGSQVDTALYETMEKRHLRMVLGRAVGPHIMDRILQSEYDVLKSERMTITVLYADIRESTQMAEETEPELLVGFINDYLHTMNEIIIGHEGTLDKFIGDQVMALFGAPIPQADFAHKAVNVAQEMQWAHADLMERWSRKGIKPRPIGIGIATGELIVGEMGSTQRMDYTVMGNAANLGARICSTAAGGEILMCSETFETVRGTITAVQLEPMQFKGVQQVSTVYKLV
ncbi:MAG: adenylate/guanylate cyclase domain-containing protein [Chloroflexota bacterium]